MEVPLQTQRPIWSRPSLCQNAQFNSRPFTGFFSYKPSSTRLSQPYSWHIEYPVNGVLRPFAAAGDFSKKKQKKLSTPRKGHVLKGFAPKNPTGTNSQKRDQRNATDNRTSVTPSPELHSRAPEVGSSSADTQEVSEVAQVNGIKDQNQSEDSINGKVGDSLPADEAGAVASRNLLKEIDNVTGFIGEGETNVIVGDLDDNQGNTTVETYASTEVDDDHDGSEGISGEKEADDLKTISKTSYEKELRDLVSVQQKGSDITTYVKKVKDLVSFQQKGSDITSYEKKVGDLVGLQQKGSNIATYVKEVKDLADVQENRTSVNYPFVESHDNDTETKVLGSVTRGSDSDKKEGKDLAIHHPESDLVNNQNLESDKIVTETSNEKELEDYMQKLELEREAQVLEQLAEENFSKGNKIFMYPGIATPDNGIKLFLNRSLSTLKDEPHVMIMGAFNDWRWKSFTMRLEKSNLKGDWWSCRIHVPKEAYIIDFVFFNGKDVYDNNDMKDFHVTVDGGMDTFAFDDFLLEEKRRELNELAREQAERERQAEEQRQREEEKAALEADRSQAKLEVQRSREQLMELTKNSSTTAENVWYFEPRKFKGGDLVRLCYNKSSGPLAQANEIWIHGGHNGWQDGLSIIAKLEKSEKEGDDWWYAKVTVPDQALVLDWVFADGPPQQARVYDNNQRQDFHAVVPQSIPDEMYWVEEEHRIYKRLQEERRLREEAIRAKAEKTARMKAETKERTMKVFLLSQRHIVYTDPLDIQAGSDVTVYYNPSNTVLNGKPEVWFRCSFNRWTHRRGPLPPQKMVPAENGSHVKATVKVPLDAYMMDFVLSEREDGGIFDNKNGMDYHIPVFGGIAKEPPMHIVHIAVEMAPIAKVGGLGDVVTSLSRAIQDLNHHVNIVLPKYDCLNFNQVKDLHYQKSYAWGGTEIQVWFGKVEGLPVYFLDPQNGMFRTGSVYAGKNDGERFGFFCHAALEFLLQSGLHPDIIHCHDWSSAPVAWLYKEHYRHYGLTNARVVFTIHNLEFGAYFIGKAMAFADKVTTVSDTYSKEVAGNPAIAPHLYKFHGILNGIDPEIWDPFNDKFIPVTYTSENVVEGKKAAKEVLQQRLSLNKADVPILGIISRLTHQKGIHLIKYAIWRTLERGGQVVLLGSAPDPRIQQDFVDLSNQLHNLHSGQARLCLTYDEPLSHLIYAGADFILVPSIFEPCGLTQLVAMRYGSIPVVRKTGGLYDTVFDVDHDKERARAQGLEPNGFNFEGADPAGVDYALNRAISAWYDGKEWLHTLRKQVMEQDWSWNRPALEYLELYHAARKY